MSLRFEAYYKVIAGDDLGSSTYWNSRFQDIDVRINACEAFQNTADSASQVIIDEGIERINTTFQPLLDGLTTQVNTLTATIATINASISTDEDSFTAQLATFLTNAQAQVDALTDLTSIDGGTF